jgi:hypothetical protein
MFQNSKLSVSLGQLSQAGKQRRHRPDCPKHALAESDFLREVSDISRDNKLKFLNALVSDKDLRNTCTCGAGAGANANELSPVAAGGTLTLSEGYGDGTGRPLSWCSGQFSGTMKIVDEAPTMMQHHGAGGGGGGGNNRQRSITVAGAEGIGRFLPAAAMYYSQLNRDLPLP